MSIDVDEFIERRKGSGGRERANFQSFARDLTDLLGVDQPKPATGDDQNDDYRFECSVFAAWHKITVGRRITETGSHCRKNLSDDRNEPYAAVSFKRSIR